ncbi:MAG: hypothetical protein NZ658_02910, partial [Pirellulales bacterium]|nr:hypothetical protein [Pirellulales bacterium]
MKPLADTLWSLVRWTLPLTVAAVIVAVALGSHRVSEEVRRRVESRLQAHFPELRVEVRSASLVEGDGIIIRGISFTAREAANGGELLAIEEIHLGCGTSLTELASGEPQIRSVRLRRPVVHALRDRDGHWNIAPLLEARGAGLGVPVDVEDATLAVVDEANGREFQLRTIAVELRPEGGGDGQRLTVLRGRVGGDLFDRAEFEGQLDADG